LVDVLAVGSAPALLSIHSRKKGVLKADLRADESVDAFPPEESEELV
jgi:hypothetical protein